MRARCWSHSADVRRSRRAEPLGGIVGAAGGAERSCWRSGAELPAERSGAQQLGLRMFHGMRVTIDYKLSVSSVPACATPNWRSRNAGRDGNTYRSKLTLSKGRTVGCTESVHGPRKERIRAVLLHLLQLLFLIKIKKARRRPAPFPRATGLLEMEDEIEQVKGVPRWHWRQNTGNTERLGVLA